MTNAVETSSEEAPPITASAIATLVATGFALIAFVVAIVSGALAGLDLGVVVRRAIATLAISWPVGWVVLRAVFAAVGLGAASRSENTPGADDGVEQLQRAEIHDTDVDPALELDRATARAPDPPRGAARARPEENPTVRHDLRLRAS